MFAIGQGRAAIARHDDVEIHVERGARRRLAADIRFRPGNDHGLDPAAAQDAFELGSAGRETAVAVLLDQAVLVVVVHFVPQERAVTAGRHVRHRALAHVRGDDVIEEVFPVAAAAAGIEHADDPDHLPARAAQGLRERVDVRDDTARGRDFRRRARLAERVLHIDDDQGGFRGLDLIINMVAAAARHDALDDIRTDIGIMHRE